MLPFLPFYKEKKLCHRGEKRESPRWRNVVSAVTLHCLRGDEAICSYAFGKNSLSDFLIRGAQFRTWRDVRSVATIRVIASRLVPLGDTMADCLARVPKMPSVATNSRASRYPLRRRRANLLAWVSNISLFVRVCQNKSLHLLSAKIEWACRKILKYFCFSLALCYLWDKSRRYFRSLRKKIKQAWCFSLAYSYLCTDSSVHAVGGWGRHFGKDVYERYLEVFKSRKFD